MCGMLCDDVCVRDYCVFYDCDVCVLCDNYIDLWMFFVCM